MRKLNYPAGGLVCPLTRGTRTRFTCFDVYAQNCTYQKNKTVVGFNNRKTRIYQVVCSKCINYKKVTELVHGAEIITLRELVAMRKSFESRILR